MSTVFSAIRQGYRLPETEIERTKEDIIVYILYRLFTFIYYLNFISSPIMLIIQTCTRSLIIKNS